jgi:hypothetical protein
MMETTLNNELIDERSWPTLNARQKRGFVDRQLSSVAKIFVLLFAVAT